MRANWKSSGLALAIGLISPAAMAAPVIIDFTRLALGASVEGLGTVNPLLDIEAAKGAGVAVFAGQALPANAALGLGSGRVHVASTVPGPLLPTDGGIVHGHVGAKGGFADNLAVGSASANRGPNDFVFTFAQGYAAKSFAVTMLDFGDNDPSLATTGSVTWTAYNKLGQVVDQTGLTITIVPDISAGSQRVVYDFIQGSYTPMGSTTVAMNPQQDSDASAPNGKPGNTTFNLTGNGITKVAVTWTNDGGDWTDNKTNPSSPVFIKAVKDQPLDPKIAYTGLAVDFVKVPEPMSLGLLSIGLLGLGLARRRR